MISEPAGMKPFFFFFFGSAISLLEVARGSGEHWLGSILTMRGERCRGQDPRAQARGHGLP